MSFNISFFCKKIDFVSGLTLQHMGSQFPDQGLNSCSLQWKHRVLTTRPTRKVLKSLKHIIYKFGKMGPLSYSYYVDTLMMITILRTAELIFLLILLLKGRKIKKENESTRMVNYQVSKKKKNVLSSSKITNIFIYLILLNLHNKDHKVVVILPILLKKKLGLIGVKTTCSKSHS